MREPKPIRPRRFTRREWGILAGSLVLFGGMITLAAMAYDAEGGSRTAAALGPSADSGLILTLDPVSVDATRNTAVLHVNVGGQGAVLNSDARLAQNTRIMVSSASGIIEQRLLAGTAPGQFDITVGMDGEEARYPFDAHEAMLLITADSFTKNADGTFTSTGPIEVGVQGGGGVNGWDTTYSLATAMVDTSVASIAFQRAFSTQAFALLILLLAGLLAAFALTIGVLVVTRRRKVEAALLSWTAALLFALPLLRNYLPNGPPVGASFDIFYYLWVIVVTVVANALVIIGWVSQRRDELLEELEQRDAA